MKKSRILNLPQNPTPIKFVGEWQGGRPQGSINLVDNYGLRYRVRFSNPSLRKCFSTSKYQSQQHALKAAKEFRRKEAEKRGKIKNMWRTVEFKNEKYIEVQLQEDFIMLCDKKDLNLIKGRAWMAEKSHKTEHLYYATSSGTSKRRYLRFHRLITDYKEVDHINGNGLDNRKKNLRDGSEGVNQNNQTIRTDNSSGMTGVHYSKYNRSWTVQWAENGKRKCKKFRVWKKRSYDKAMVEAMQFKLHINERLGLSNGTREKVDPRDL